MILRRNIIYCTKEDGIEQWSLLYDSLATSSEVQPFHEIVKSCYSCELMFPTTTYYYYMSPNAASTHLLLGEQRNAVFVMMSQNWTLTHKLFLSAKLQR